MEYDFHNSNKDHDSMRIVEQRKTRNREENRGRRSAVRFMLFYVGKHKVSVAAGVIVLMVVDLFQLVIPRVVQRVIDMLGESAFSYSLMLQNTMLIIGLALGMVVLRFFWRLFIIGSARKIEKEVREDMFSHLQGLGFTYFNRSKTGSIMALMVNDVNAIRMATGPSFIALTDAVFMGTLSLFFMLTINVRLTIFAVLPLPGILFMIARFGPLIQRRFKAVQETFAGISSFTQEAFSGIRVVKGFTQENYEIEKFAEKSEDYVEKNLKLINVWGLFFPTITLLANLSLAILYLVGGQSVIIGSFSFGEFVSFAMYINLLVWPVIAIGWVFNLLQRGIASAKRILDLLETHTDVADRGKVHVLSEEIRGKIEITNLTFVYPGERRAVLDHIDLSIPEGSSLGIMGRPGSGKSTLVSLLFRLFPVERSHIFLDGIEIHEYPLALLRSFVGYVPQDPFLFSDTIRNNISFGLDESSDDEEIGRIARLTGIFDEVMEFGERFETVVGERGITLSGGQKQRISIARALLKDPRILVLDDAFSAVDAAKEKDILFNIRKEMEGRTVFIISHRVSTIMDCTRILVLDNGRIAEQGTHTELIAEEGYYRSLFELQQLEEQRR
jgi:ATP-binding cassette subfamily B protein